MIGLEQTEVKHTIELHIQVHCKEFFIYFNFAGLQTNWDIGKEIILILDSMLVENVFIENKYKRK